LSEVYFQASSFFEGNPIVSNSLIASQRKLCISLSTSQVSSKARNDDISLSFNSIFSFFLLKGFKVFWPSAVSLDFDRFRFLGLRPFQVSGLSTLYFHP